MAFSDPTEPGERQYRWADGRMSRRVRCEACGKRAVFKVGERPGGVSLWSCALCGDAKRWCPRCDQGWVRRYQVTGIERDMYSCDECEATWENALQIRPPGVDRRTFLDSRLGPSTDADLSPIRESVHDINDAELE